MKTRLLITSLLIMLVFLLGYGYYFMAEQPAEITHKAIEQRFSLPAKRNVIAAKLPDIAVQAKDNHYLLALTDVSGLDLKTRLDTFWQRCQLLQQCEAWLQQLQTEVAASQYQLFASYAEKRQQLGLSMGQNFKSSGGNLSDNIEHLKQKQAKVFGDMSAQIFAQDYALYDYKEKVAQIQTDNLGADLAYKVAALDQLRAELMASQPSTASQPGFLSAQALYQQALTFIDQEQSVQAIAQQKKFLAQHYLPTKKAAAVIQRQQQISTQRLQRQQYQQDFADFQEQLNTQRQINSEGFSQAQWQHYQEQKIFEFRRDYFK